MSGSQDFSEKAPVTLWSAPAVGAPSVPVGTAANPLVVTGATGGSGSGTSTANQGTAGTAAWPVSDTQSAAFTDLVPITPGTAFAAGGRSLFFVCTTAGTITVTFSANGRQVTFPIIASPALQSYPFNLTNVALGTAAGTFWNATP